MTFSNAQGFFHLAGFAGLVVACTTTIDGGFIDPDGGVDGYGGSVAQGGAAQGGSPTGGSTGIGGMPATGGTAQGGVIGTGGATPLGGTGPGGTGVTVGGTGAGSAAGLGGTGLGGAGLGGTGLGGTALGGTAGVGGTATGGTATGGTATGGTTGTTPFASVSSIIQTRCATATCHGGRRNPNLTAANLYATLTATAVRQCGSDRLVTPSDPANSALLELVNGLCGTFIMPDTCRTAPCLPAAETQTITAWIQAGAHNP